MRREVPDPWAAAMIERGLVYAKRPSIRALARAADIPSSETVRQMIHGESSPDVATTNAVAKALGVTGPVVRRWIGQAAGSASAWQVPDEIDLLTDEERAAITVLIRAIAKPRRSKEAGYREYGRRLREHGEQLQAEQDEYDEELRLAARRGKVQVSPDAAAQDAAGEEDQRGRDDR